MSDPVVAFLLFPDAEELDFAGPWEMFSVSAMVRNGGTLPSGQVFSATETGNAVRCAKGMQVIPDYAIDNAPPFDILLVPGGQGTRKEMKNERLLAWIKERAADCQWVTSVCTGSMVLAAAGLTAEKSVTTYWGVVEQFRELNLAKEVRGDVRYVRDGNIVTSAGVSAGIDMSLWLLGEIYGADHARAVQKYAEYYPQPPYAGSV